MCITSTTNTTSSSSSSSSPSIIPPSYTPGYERKKNVIWAIIAGWFALYILLLIPGATLHADPSLCTNHPHTTTPPNQQHCSRPDLFAFEIICITAFLTLAYLTIPAYYGTRTQPSVYKSIASTTPEGRLYGYIDCSVEVSTVFVAFQVWDFLISPMIPEFFTGVMMVHHLLAGIGGWFCLQHQHFHYYAAFYLGLSEISSIPLVLMTLSNYFPPPPNTIYSTIATLAGPAFALTFGYFRVYQWGKLSIRLWLDCYYVLSKGLAEQYRPGKSYVLYSTLVITALLSGLQLYWFSLILQRVGRDLGGWTGL